MLSLASFQLLVLGDVQIWSVLSENEKKYNAKSYHVNKHNTRLPRLKWWIVTTHPSKTTPVYYLK